MTAVIGRFAPSPTGPLHLGNLRTAVAVQMFAREESGGRVLVRMEDLDRVTSKRELALAQLVDLAAVGVRTSTEVVYQSDRFPLYDEYLTKLEGMGLTYPCFCTRREVREAAQAPHGEVMRYPDKVKNTEMPR